MKILKSAATRHGGALFLALGLATSNASATLIGGTSGGQAVALDVGLLGTPMAGAYVGSAGGSYPASYANDSGLLTLDFLANASGGAGVLGEFVEAETSVSAGAEVVQAQAQGNGGAVSGYSLVTGFTLDTGTSASALGGFVELGQANVGAAVQTLSSTSSISDTATGLSSFAQSVVLGVDVGALLDLVLIDIGLLGDGLFVADLSSDTVGFNFDVFDFLGVSDITSALGLSLVANEMVDTCAANDTSSSCGVMTNALHLGLDLLNFDGSLVDIDLVLGHSFAEADWKAAREVPVPGTLALLGLGLCGLALRRQTARLSR